MKERPILFNDEMVRAILDGRKTQTRRVVKDPHGLYSHMGDKSVHPAVASIVHVGEGEFEQRAKSDAVKQQYVTTFPFHRLRCPYGQPGDQLWVREAFRSRRVDNLPGEVAYRADHPGEKTVPGSYGRPWKPSIHMPRWACRLRLEVTAVRVERLQDITEVDAQAEGAGVVSFPNVDDQHTDRDRFRALWNRINGPESWDTNPWVWVVEFQRVDSEVPS
ncbi:hypothetical protein [Halomonas caseinilytica]|uniref:ASCH domain-containing protein n=1 Tax=Halomonas caseinilytica TaxID=438744 RepID=A0A1M6T6P8_9GAMM|nr:hypothetical protein [Halomonas caseinilytica]SHK52584.1 hypothetical protein SAMN05192556_103232 [Halomonas caseinilytica]